VERLLDVRTKGGIDSITVRPERLPTASAAVASGKRIGGKVVSSGCGGDCFGVLEGLEKLAGVLTLTPMVRARLPFVT
jgi:hypothetical protein